LQATRELGSRPSPGDVEPKVSHAVDIKEYALASAGNSKERALTNAAPRDYARPPHVHVCFCKAPGCSAATTLSFGGSNIDGEHFAQYASGCVSI
jgi:hypothetical protein